MSLSVTQMQDAIITARANNYFSEFEGNFSNYGAFQAALDGANLLLPENMVKSMKNSAAQTTKVPVLNKATLAIITDRSCSITGNDPTSAFQNITYATKGFEITVSPSVSDGNYISLEDQFNNGLRNGLRSIFPELEIAAIAKLETDKSAVLATSYIATQATGAYVLESAGDIYYDIPTIMKLNDLKGRYVNVTNTEAQKNMLKYESQGQNNAVNLAGVLNGSLPSAGNYRHYMSNEITLGSNREVHYMYPEGSFGVYQWNPQDFVKKRETSAGKKFYTFEDPFLGITWSVIEETTCADLSATYSGLTTAHVTKYQFTCDLAFMTAYSSDTSSPILKFNLPAEV